jgi:predicted nucleic acid-binding protein
VTAWVAEPPAAYAAKPVAVVDCSVVAAAVFLEPAAREADALTRAYRLVSPSLLAYELANVAANKLRRGETPADMLTTQLASLDADVVELADVPPLGAFALAQRYGLTAYDASYLWLAAELRAPLITFDRRLGLAAQEHMRSLGAP